VCIAYGKEKLKRGTHKKHAAKMHGHEKKMKQKEIEKVACLLKKKAAWRLEMYDDG
jgi:hypothetical protein